MHKM